MAPKQDHQAEKITAVESQIANLVGAIDGLRVTSEKHDHQFAESVKLAEERHLQLMAMFQHQPAVAATQKKGESEGSAPKTQGLQIQPEKEPVLSTD
ncbi:hypothetical protein F2Q69_00020647 [Brassica cretica]|uniref:Uncharacterized protein n=1 Tax=Brassica cretica TaxID=69181 RepID=A0A8S9QRZ3_BRACR|nr:hypothetical protein F2Q69_00020647 [Brassica cretica]